MRFIFLAFLLLATISCVARRSVDAVINPQKFTAFEEICDSNCFDDAWKSNREWMLSNFAHVAYYDKDLLCSTLVRFVDTKASCPAIGDNDQAPLIRIYDVESAQGFLVVWPEKAVLTFRGTESKKLKDLLADASLYRSVEGTAKVHTGFKKQVDLLWDKHILPDLEKYAKGKPVWVTGHSLGAGMAVIAGMRYPFEEVVTFGEPRVGYGIESAFKAKKHTRVVNGDDLIANIPPKKSSVYEHHGTLQRICDPVAGANALYDHAIGDYARFLGSENNACKK
jgi:hypothetical protein